MKIPFFTLALMLLMISIANSQVLISDESGIQEPDPSAILEIKSTTQGLLIPRMNSEQRALLAATAADGLLIYDTDEAAFFLYGNGAWVDLSSSAEIWSKSASNVYLTNGTDNIGVGTSSPGSKFVIQADGSDTRDDVLFEVIGTDGIPVFEVTTNGVKVSVNGDAKSVSRGFAVGQYNTAKLTEFKDYFTVDNFGNAKVHMHDDGTKAISGGFAVGQYNTAKDYLPIEEYLNVAPEQVQVNNTLSSGKAVSGGFAVGQYNTAKGKSNFMQITPENYFIGHRAGEKMTTGISNIFVGFQSGLNNQTGVRNTFIGHNSGFTNKWGDNNIYIGDSAGYMTEYAHDNIFLGNSAGYHTEADDMVYGSQNVFIGNFSGYKNLEGFYNVYVGQRAGHGNLNGSGNVFVGGLSGEVNTRSDNTFVGGASFYKNTSGNHNASLGAYSGINNLTGSGNVFLGYSAGYNELGSNRLYIDNSNTAAPLIYGQFDTDRVGINTGAPTANLHIKQIGAGEEGFAIENDTDTDTWSWEIGANYLFLYFNGIQKGSWNDIDGSYNSVSDESLKIDIETVPNVLDKINKLKVVEYYFKDDKKRDNKSIGLIAQDVEKVFPSVVNKPEEENNDAFYSMNYSAFGPIAIKAIQEQQSQIDELKKQIEDLKELIQK